MEFFNVRVSPRAIELAVQTLQSGWISEGVRVREFEASLSRDLGLANPVAVNSGTAALHLALALVGVGPGDEVILPAQTFVATGLVILMQGACPVFADIDPRTGNITPASIKRKITSRTKALIVVHWGGYPCDLDEINRIAADSGLAVIEDAAHALGSDYRGKPLGSISRFTAFSFQAIKHLTTGDGGALCCASETDAAEAIVRRWFGIDRAGSKPSILGERKYDISSLGYKYHMNDLAAAVGLGNLEGFRDSLARRQHNASFYREELDGVPGMEVVGRPKDRTHAYWLFTILVEKREQLIRKLQADGIPSSVVHLRIDRNSVFGGVNEDLPGQAWFDERQLAIPVHSDLSDSDLQRVVRSIRAGW